MYSTFVPRNGFIIIISLIFFSTVMLLFVLFFSLIRTENLNLGNIKDRQIAKLNNNFSTKIAIAFLQKEMGLDSRVNANSQILDTNLQNSTEDIAQSHWTGVWDPRANSFVNTTHSSSRKDALIASQNWLVSGNERLKKYTPDQILPEEESMILLDEIPKAYQNSLNHKPVRAPSVLIQKKNIGTVRYAFWIEDEGSKSRINIAPQKTLSSAGKQTYPHQSGLSFFSNPNNLLGKDKIFTNSCNSVVMLICIPCCTLMVFFEKSSGFPIP